MPDTIGYNRNQKIRRVLSKEMEGKLKSAHDRLLAGQRYRQKEREAEWDDARDLYMNEHWNANADDPTADIVNVNVAFSTINTLVPFVADEDPSFLLTPYSGDATMEHALVLQSFLNRLWQSSDVRGQTHLSDAVFDWLLYGDGYMKVGYNIKQQELYDALGDPIDNRVDIADFWVQRLSPWDVWIDPYSDGIHNARWVCQRIIMPISELENDPRYKLRDDDVPQAGVVDSRNLSPEDQLRLDEVELGDWTAVFEFYDLVDDYMISFLPGGSQAVRYIERIQCPIVQITNYRIPNSPYHMGEIEQISALQHELNKTRSQMITHRRRNVGKWVIRQHALNEDAEQAMRSSITNDVIAIEAPEPLDYLIDYLDPQPISQDSYALDAQIRADINELTGVNEYLRGVPQNISRTATEATIIEGATNTRTRHKLLSVERAARDTGQIFLDIIRDVLPLTNFEEMRMYITGHEAERLNRVTGQENIDTDLIFTPTREVFRGKYEVSVERGSTELRNPQLKAQKYMQIVQLMLSALPAMYQLQIPFNYKKLLELWLEAEGIEDVDALFEIDETARVMQELMMLQQAQAAAGGAAGANGGAPAGGGGGRTPAGQPRPQTTNPPSTLPDAGNSGIIGARY